MNIDEEVRLLARLLSEGFEKDYWGDIDPAWIRAVADGCEADCDYTSEAESVRKVLREIVVYYFRELAEHREDVRLASGELLIPIPEPGTETARLLRANVLMRRERDEARAQVKGAKEAKARCTITDEDRRRGGITASALLRRDGRGRFTSNKKKTRK